MLFFLGLHVDERKNDCRKKCNVSIKKNAPEHSLLEICSYFCPGTLRCFVAVYELLGSCTSLSIAETNGDANWVLAESDLVVFLCVTQKAVLL